jgi:hypothetical protein
MFYFLLEYSVLDIGSSNNLTQGGALGYYIFPLRGINLTIHNLISHRASHILYPVSGIPDQNASFLSAYRDQIIHALTGISKF